MSSIKAISWQEQVTFKWNDEDIRFVLDQHAYLDFYSTSSLKQHYPGGHVTKLGGGCCACDHMVVGYITTYAISAYNH